MIEAPDIAVQVAAADTSAARAAFANFTANLAALCLSQPVTAADVFAPPADVEWVYARDGALTHLRDGKTWWAGCSLPFRAAEAMLREAVLDGTLLCFLHAQHAAQLRVALDRARPNQAVLALVGDAATLETILACGDFTGEISSHRLYFAAGENWLAHLEALFDALPGLATPTQFIRPILADAAPADAMIAPAQEVFAEHSRRRAERVRLLRETWRPTGAGRVCVVAPSHFRLWDDAGAALLRVIRSLPDSAACISLDSDDPASASAAALAEAVRSCDALAAPNLGRGDFPDVVPDDMPWVSWITRCRFPSADRAAPGDALIVTDPAWKAMAVAKGWEDGQVFIGGWPRSNWPSATTTQATAGAMNIASSRRLILVADTCSLEPPPTVTEYSSRRLLWESIGHELLEDPFAVGLSADAFFDSRLQRSRVQEQGLDRSTFLDGVVQHAWLQGVARALIRAGFSPALYGSGWAELYDCRQHSAGPVTSHAQLSAALSVSAALVCPVPGVWAHPVDATGLPVLRATRGRNALVREARRFLGGAAPAPLPRAQELSADVVRQALKEMRSSR